MKEGMSRFTLAIRRFAAGNISVKKFAYFSTSIEGAASPLSGNDRTEGHAWAVRSFGNQPLIAPPDERTAYIGDSGYASI